MLPSGSYIAGYRVQRVIGSGGMGTVYAVADPALPRTDALKVLSAELSADEQFRARFLREADIAAMLDHPNIVSVYDRGESSDGKLWIAMQFVDGIDADDALKAGTMTPMRALHIAGAVADALDYAHGRAMVHRDVKPANFLLSGPVGADERVLLGDFGIARALDDAAHQTATGSVMATMPYASPESIDGGAVDGRADQYSLACSLYRMLTGRLPFEAATGVAPMMMAHLTAPPPRISQTAPWLPHGLDAVFATAMAKDPQHRFRSCNEFVAAAAATFNQAAAAATFTPAVAAMVEPTAVLPAAPAGPPVGPPGAEPPRAPRRWQRWAVLAAVVVLVAGGATYAALPSDTEQTPDAQPSAPPISDTALPDVLLRPEQIGKITGRSLIAKPPTTELLNDSTVTSAPDCAGAMFPLQVNYYSNSGYTKIYSQLLVPATGDGIDSIRQSVLAFGSEDLAASSVQRQAQLWQPCAGKKVSIYGTGATPPQAWSIDAVSTAPDLSTTRFSRAQDPMTCEHALTSVRNIVIDVFGCQRGANVDGVAEVARAIAARAPG